jgi:hypothetical protein
MENGAVVFERVVRRNSFTRFEVLRAVNIKAEVLWDVIP